MRLFWLMVIGVMVAVSTEAALPDAPYWRRLVASWALVIAIIGSAHL